MATVLVNGEHEMILSEHEIKRLPDPFGIHDFEEILVAASERIGLLKFELKEVFVNGAVLDRKKLRGFSWKELGITNDTVIGVFAEAEKTLQESEEQGCKQLRADQSKKRGRSKSKKRFDEERPQMTVEEVRNYHFRKSLTGYI